jgi:hypothetical protein
MPSKCPVSLPAPWPTPAPFPQGLSLRPHPSAP